MSMRIRILFAKTAAMRYSGHLDLHRAWERTFRRAALPLAYSQGYNPRPKLNLASALPLGFTSQGELLDAWLEKELPIEQVQNDLVAALPPGLTILSLEAVPLELPALQALLESSHYRVTLLQPLPDLAERIAALLAANEWLRERRGKSYDLRPRVLSLRLLEDTPAGQNLEMELLARESATGRPDEVLLALGADPNQARIQRLSLQLRQSQPTTT